MANQNTVGSLNKKKGCCISIILIIIVAFIILGAIFIPKIPNHAAYLNCIMTAKEDNPYTDWYDSFSESTVTREGETFIISFREFEVNGYGNGLIVSDMKCKGNYRDGGFEVDSLVETDQYMAPLNN